MVMFFNCGLATNAKLPRLFAESPTLVKFGAAKLLKKFSSKIREPLTLAKDGMLRLEIFLNVMLLAQIRLGKLMSKLRPLEAMLTP